MDKELYVHLKDCMESTFFRYGTDDDKKESLIYRLYDIMLYKMIVNGLFPYPYGKKELDNMFCLDGLEMSEKNYLSTCGYLISGILQELGWSFERYSFSAEEVQDFYASKGNILVMSLRQRILSEVLNCSYCWEGVTLCLISNPLIDYAFGEESPLSFETKESLERRVVSYFEESCVSNGTLFWWRDNYYWILIADGEYEDQIPMGWIRNANLITPFYGKWICDTITAYLQEC